MVAKARTNTKAEFSILDWDVPLILVSARISGVLGLPTAHFEPASRQQIILRMLNNLRGIYVRRRMRTRDRLRTAQACARGCVRP